MQGIARRKPWELPCEGRGRAGSPCPLVPGMPEEGGGDAQRSVFHCARAVPEMSWRNLGGAAFSRATDLEMWRG